ncbi:Asp-tRNA(Asn)/Glu-tRNA(Gln) amidotransferase subunit GatC [Polynucleobacter sp. MWH-Spelu-300-X4]|jgi:aspartyl-tRNA(Asn)/glutamyl-tRNA(Gln) amidotransferase subunit C|uniref:Asp-tRNA(Asn)/Glu-tRNA(Gln) amidotransferase subunit GatC n=1 Tax=Polynucleobacter sp. MWH-Spelu-300-X4 TaxID=2689109 RepID=UPI001BFEE513|nr:Asp-tRNA(Asn)/Glu-tRNA(Gln) amidotransferase subunit GatC [Polynucleobacter sp. MWH-Spelu-300-X4]QWD79729.1 Asp-tRNA(Asn)/Glu-tRNA(Gln) amidotransferase subunit GatC [Polynucleobacter sp. MWH-Spelu-300-X4]
MNLEDVKRIAQLSRLAITDDEAASTLNQLQKVFDLVEQMQAVNTDGIEPLAHPIEQIMSIAQPLREDVVTEIDQRDAYLQNAPAQHEGLFLVPKVIE